MAEHIFLRGTVWQVHYKIPRDLLHLFPEKARSGKLECSLKTKDKQEAKRRARAQIDVWDRKFAELRNTRTLDDKDIESLALQHYNSVLAEDDEMRRSMPTTEQMEAEELRVAAVLALPENQNISYVARLNLNGDLELMHAMPAIWTNRRLARSKASKAALSTYDTELMKERARTLMSSLGVAAPTGSTMFRELCVALMRAEIDAIDRTFERDEGEHHGTARDPLIRKAAAAQAQGTNKKRPLLELFENYALENPENIKPDTINQARRDFGTLLQMKDAPITTADLNKELIRDWKSLLLQYPVKAAEISEFKGMKIADIVARNATLGKPVIKRQTVNRYLANVGAFCSWLVNNGFIESNPTTGMGLKKDKSPKKHVFNTDELVTLFGSPLFTGCQAETPISEWAIEGPTRIRDHRFWIPILMLYSGARPGELAQLAIEDIRSQSGIWFMHINDTGDDDKSVKTAGSVRVVPIHTTLIELGFIDYVHSVKVTKSKRVFPKADLLLRISSRID